MDRRRFLQLTAVSAAGAGLAGCGDDQAADVPEGGMDLGSLDEVRAAVEQGGGAWYVAEAKAYVVEVPAEHRRQLAGAVDESLRPGIDAGFLALWQKCPHQGCRVPYCEDSGWFECPCHGSRYSSFGELRRGPADQGMSYFPLAVEGGGLRLLPGDVDGLDDDVLQLPDPGDHCV